MCTILTPHNRLKKRIRSVPILPNVVIHVSIINYHVDMIKHVIVIHEHDITNLTR